MYQQGKSDKVKFVIIMETPFSVVSTYFHSMQLQMIQDLDQHINVL